MKLIAETGRSPMGSFLLRETQLGVSKNNGTLKSSILIGFSIINHPFWGTPIFGNIQLISCGFHWFCCRVFVGSTNALACWFGAFGALDFEKIPENERDWDSWVYPDSNPKPLNAPNQQVTIS